MDWLTVVVLVLVATGCLIAVLLVAFVVCIVIALPFVLALLVLDRLDVAGRAPETEMGMIERIEFTYDYEWVHIPWVVPSIWFIVFLWLVPFLYFLPIPVRITRCFARVAVGGRTERIELDGTEIRAFDEMDWVEVTSVTGRSGRRTVLGIEAT